MAVKVNVIGRLGADAEVREGKNGKFVTFRVATDEYKNNTNETIWLSVSDFTPRTLKLAEYLKKGKLIDVSGIESCRLYNDKNGQTQIARDILADRVEFVNAGASGNTTTTTEATTTSNIPTDCGTLKPPTPQPSMVSSAVDEEDDLPF